MHETPGTYATFPHVLLIQEVEYIILIFLQMISLGAGFDTTFFRMQTEGLLSKCKVFEVRCYSSCYIAYP